MPLDPDSLHTNQHRSKTPKQSLLTTRSETYNKTSAEKKWATEKVGKQVGEQKEVGKPSGEQQELGKIQLMYLKSRFCILLEYRSGIEGTEIDFAPLISPTCFPPCCCCSHPLVFSTSVSSPLISALMLLYSSLVLYVFRRFRISYIDMHESQRNNI